MKKFSLLFLAVFLFQAAKAQVADYPKNEIKFNIANVMIIASAEIGYERFVAENQSIEFIALINDRINYHSEKGSRKFKTNSFKLGYNYYFGSETAGSGIYANPFIKLRTGDFEERKNIEGTATKITTNMDAFIIGFGVGYKWNYGDKFVFGPYANIARNFSDNTKDRFTAFEFNTGISIGYRF
ncbi:outer membrane autotransporter protein [Mesonia hippocampi]|uniref:Outer membrane autotransporter protein n=1 Tax=Mesonia hippocampi TaxID=1628250 RepID=A0A840ESG9_9FLAO|nr:autotransporter outer membrane beta-barrel domain-containing protein [Mesonia hippocampi]MBB4118316.1 outer membrane autotransporter protein [Mesonia hippocampi]